MKVNGIALLWLLGGVLMALMIANVQVGSQAPQTEVSFSEFLAESEQGRVAEVTIQGQSISGT